MCRNSLKTLAMEGFHCICLTVTFAEFFCNSFSRKCLCVTASLHLGRLVDNALSDLLITETSLACRHPCVLNFSYCVIQDALFLSKKKKNVSRSSRLKVFWKRSALKTRKIYRKTPVLETLLHASLSLQLYLNKRL